MMLRVEGKSILEYFGDKEFYNLFLCPWKVPVTGGNFTSRTYSNSMYAKPVDKDTIVPFKVEKYWLSTILSKQSLKYTTHLDTLVLIKNRAGEEWLFA